MSKIDNKKINKKLTNNTSSRELTAISITIVSIILIIFIYFNAGGIIGKSLSSLFKGLFGIGAYLLPIIMILFSAYIFFSENVEMNIFKIILSFMAFCLFITFFHILNRQDLNSFKNYSVYLFSEYKAGKFFDGGVIGALIGDIFLKTIGPFPSYISVIILFIINIFLLFGKSFIRSWDLSFNDLFNELGQDFIAHNKKREHKLPSKKYDDYDEQYEEDCNYTDNYIDYNPNFTYNKNINIENDFPRQVFKKYNSNIFSGIDKHKILEKPVFFNMNTQPKVNEQQKILFAIDEINNPKKYQYKKIEQEKDFINNSQKNEHKIFDESFRDSSFIENNKKQNIDNNKREDITKEKVEEYNLSKNQDKNELSRAKSKDELIDKVYKKKKSKDEYLTVNKIFSIDLEFVKNSSIEEIFDNPPEDFLSEDTENKYLDNLDRFYDFDKEEIDKNIDIFDASIKEEKQEINLLNENNSKNLDKTIDNLDKNIQNINKPTIIRPTIEKMISTLEEDTKEGYIFPKLNFLNKNNNVPTINNDIQLIKGADILINTLKSFNIDAQVLNISQGPSITKYEISIQDGIKLSEVLGLTDNIALSLAANCIKIEAPVLGKSVVGIEITNKKVKDVFLSEILCTESFQLFPSILAVGLGKDIIGNIVILDITKIANLLITGDTNSGKTTCINTIIMSILYKATPNDVKFIIIDTKIVELNIYNGIPHLLIPVITQIEKARVVLNWSVSEMIKRYSLFEKSNVKNIRSYNKLQESNKDKLSQIVIIIDEIADIMMLHKEEIETYICKLSQLGKSVGIYLIIATQNPSTDIITKRVKSNIPYRITFNFSNQINYNYILDSKIEEKLIGKGDMLFKNISEPLRIQGAFISDSEIQNIVNFIKENNKFNYHNNIANKTDFNKEFGNNSSK